MAVDQVFSKCPERLLVRSRVVTTIDMNIQELPASTEKGMTHRVKVV